MRVLEHILEGIIIGCKKDIRKSQQQLFDRYAGIFLTVSRQYAPEDENPMDILHDSFIKIFEGIKLYDFNKGNFESWARRIVINTAINKLREKKIMMELSHIDERQFLTDDGISLADNMEEMMRIIERLPDGYKQVFCLYEIEGYSHKEIAEILQMHESSSRAKLSRSKQMLRNIMKESTNFLSLNIQTK